MLVKLNSTTFSYFFFVCFFAEAFDPLDPSGNITIRWDVMGFTTDGYELSTNSITICIDGKDALVTIYNFQKYRRIQSPGWSLRWTWGKNEIIRCMLGAQATEKGNCSSFKATFPHSCEKTPMIFNSLPSTPYNQQIGTCGKWGGLVECSWLLDPAYLWMQDRVNSVVRFQVTVGQAGTNNRTNKLPYNFTLSAPGPGYICGPAKIVKHTIFPTPGGRRITQAIMTWEVRCTYSQVLARKVPTCCVSLSSFYNNTSVPCNTCSCGCQNNTSKCVE
ncbi:hypothetical protein RchiOBHm_Chr5g0059971 [Rosa chinensis]|uniref:COBRA C-terminal domain-containing protein n=1 Tax=Rosa chinensis TaxID=74649 RepID=A0A2P6QHL0_ROSCH|nr:hypothetical protein RchiOBHm_Chr5g0059971 [Rosa chinensis]